MDDAGLVGIDFGFGQVGSELWEFMADRRRTFRDRLTPFSSRDGAGLNGAGKDMVARQARTLGETLGTAEFRRLRNRDEKRCLGQRKTARLFAKIGEGRCAYALDITAERRQFQIERQDFGFGQAAFELKGADDLLQFTRCRALVLAFEKAGHLHGDGRPARDNFAARDTLESRAQQRPRVDAPMAVETLVFVGEQQFEIARIDGVDGERQAPAAIGRCEGAQ